MHILCPHCRNPIEVVRLDPREEIACPSCGSSFKVTGEASTTAWQAQAGKKLGRFEILDTLGQGAFGTVYKAKDTRLDRVVAVKVPRAGNLGGEQDRDRFLREARSAAQLKHPFIVSLHEVGQEGEVTYLVSDFVEGVTLADYLSAHSFTPREAAKLIAELADALEYAHQQGVVHRDVKPSNVMLDGERKPHLMDFGLAKRDAGEITMTVDGQVLGTPAYMSPEQAKGEGHQVDGSSDVYSLGVILYELLTGELPFRGTPRMLLHQVLHEEPKYPRKLNDRVPRDVETICLKAMAKEPRSRYATAHELADDLRRFLGQEPIRARALGPAGRTWRWCQRQPAVAGLIATVILLLLVGTTVAVTMAMWAKRGWDRADETAQEEASQRRRAEEHFQRLQELTRQRAKASLQAAHQAMQLARSKQDNGDAAEALLWFSRGLAIAPDDATGVLETARKELGKCYNEVASVRNTWDVTGPVTRAAIDATGSFVATAREDGTVLVLNLSTGVAAGPQVKHEGGISTLTVSQDGRTLVTVSPARTVNIWDVPTGQCRVPGLRSAGAVWSVAVHPDNEMIVMGGPGDPVGHVLDARSGKELFPLIGHTGGIQAVDISPDGKFIVTGSRDGSARLWQSRDGRPHGGPLDHQAWVDVVTIARDNVHVGTGSNQPFLMRCWNLSDQTAMELPSRLSSEEVRGIVCGPKGTMMLSMSGPAARLQTAQRVQAPYRQMYSIKRGPAKVLACAYPAHNTVLTVCAGGHVTAWNVENQLDDGTAWDSFEVVADRGIAELWAEVVTGMELDIQGECRALSASQWQQKRKTLGAAPTVGARKLSRGQAMP